MTSKELRKNSNIFNGYRHPVPEERIQEWINQFGENNVELAEKLVINVNFVSNDRIACCFRDGLASLQGWHIDEGSREGKWRFAAFSASAGESGDAMIHRFRHANNLASRRHNSLFIHRSDILRESLGPEDSIVLIDDFIGSGSQASSSWDSIFGELLAEVGRVYLLVVCAANNGASVVGENTGMEVVASHFLQDSDNVFSDACKYLSSEQRSTLLEICTGICPKSPRGFGDCGLLLVFAHSCPNNSIPVLHYNVKNWEPLFRRYD